MKFGAPLVVELEKLRLTLVSGGAKLLSRSSTSMRMARARELDGCAALLIQDMVRSKRDRSRAWSTNLPRKGSLKQAARTRRLPHCLPLMLDQPAFDARRGDLRNGCSEEVGQKQPVVVEVVEGSGAFLESVDSFLCEAHHFRIDVFVLLGACLDVRRLHLVQVEVCLRNDGCFGKGAFL